jgi:hypothetical protein
MELIDVPCGLFLSFCSLPNARFGLNNADKNQTQDEDDFGRCTGVGVGPSIPGPHQLQTQK